MRTMNLNAVFVLFAAAVVLLTSVFVTRAAPAGEPGIISLFTRSARSDVLQSAHGGGTAIEFERRSTFSFDAVRDPSGRVTGSLFYFFRDFDLDFKVRMDIDCLTIDGNRAKVSGLITQISANFPLPPWALGARGSMQVEDNGNGTGDASDRYSDFHFFEATCSDDNEPYIPIDGNIVLAQ